MLHCATETLPVAATRRTPRRTPGLLVAAAVALAGLFTHGVHAQEDAGEAAEEPVQPPVADRADAPAGQPLIDPTKIQAYQQLVPCDFNGDGELNRGDADALIALIRYPELREKVLPDLTEEHLFILGDINNDALLDGRDHEAMLAVLSGDANHKSLDVPGPRRYDRPSALRQPRDASQPVLGAAADDRAGSVLRDEAADNAAGDRRGPLMGDLDEDGRISVYDVLLLEQLIRDEDIDVAQDAEAAGTPIVRRPERVDFNANGVAEVGDMEIWRNGLFPTQYVDIPDPAAPRLEPGPAEEEPLVSPAQAQVGFGADEVAIARWNVVPYQAFAGEFSVGILAFHVAGIDRVEFSVNNGPWTAVSEPRWDPRTGVESYWAVLDASSFNQHDVTVRAVAYPRRGLPRELKPLELTANYDGSLRSPAVYVRSDGDDNNPGTLLQPVRTMTRAFTLVEDGGQIIMNRPGIYRTPDFSQVPRAERPQITPTRWITVRGAEGISRRRLVVRQYERTPLRPGLDKLRWRGISFNFHFISSYYPETGQSVWFDTCRWFNSEGRGAQYDKMMSSVRVAAGITGAYATDTLCEDMFYGLTSLYFVRNCQLRKIGGDSLTNTQMIINTRVEDQQRPPGFEKYHADVLQYFGDHENVIVYNLTATALHRIQGFMMNKAPNGFRNFAFVNVLIDTVQEYERPPFSQFSSLNRHMLFHNVMLPNQRMLLRTDGGAPPHGYAGQSVLYEMCQFTEGTMGSVVADPPPGVAFLACFTAESRGADN